MKKLIKRFLKSLWFIDRDDLDKAYKDLEKDHKNIYQRHQELEHMISDYTAVFNDCVQLNHKIKKMEEFLKINYVIEPNANLFIGYRKK